MMHSIRFPALLCIGLILAVGCGPETATEEDAGLPSMTEGSAATAAPAAERPVRYTEDREPCRGHAPLRQPLFGDLHVHTSLSFDAAANSIGATPEDAYRFARGEPIDFWPIDENGKPAGEYAIDRPLDFMAVTDHGEFLGERALCQTRGSPSYDTPFCTAYRQDQRQGMVMLSQVITTETPVRVPELCGDDGALCLAHAREPWGRIVKAAEAAYDRSSECAFTSFVGYEYTGTPGVSNYHRNVIFRNGNVPELPVSYVDAPIDSELWRQLDLVCGDAGGCDYLTIPHNSNLSNGRMAPYMGIERTVEARRAYASIRQDREPIVEIFQHKGASECINGLTSVLGAPDELCDIEAVRVIGREETYADSALVDGELISRLAQVVTEECREGVGEFGMVGAGCVDATDFVRSALVVGLKEEGDTGVNPVKLGIIASTDTHAATPGAVSESDFRGAVTGEATPVERLQPGILTSGPEGNPGGLAGVWAVENSRDAIFEAMQRREVFGTSGPRIAPRFFAGWDYADGLCGTETLVADGYAGGVPMGGDLGSAPAIGAKPAFVAFAARDPADGAAPLDRLQLIKGWVGADGSMHSSVRTIAGSANGEAGANTLCAVVRDEEFDAALPAYYYLRVVETPARRWSSYDCEALGAQAPAQCTDGSVPDTVVEMAWTSPIWYRPDEVGAAE